MFLCREYIFYLKRDLQRYSFIVKLILSDYVPPAAALTRRQTSPNIRLVFFVLYLTLLYYKFFLLLLI